MVDRGSFPADGAGRRRLAGLSSLLLAYLLAVTACGGADTDETSAVTQAEEGSSTDFPQLSAATLDGGQIDFGSLEGQDSLLWFWAPW